MNFVVALGNPFDGINLIGPFNDRDDATEWAHDFCRNYEEWNVVDIEDREGYE